MAKLKTRRYGVRIERTVTQQEWRSGAKKKAMDTRAVCHQCHYTLVPQERHIDCEGVVEIKKVATSIVALLREYRVYLRDVWRLLKKLKSAHIIEEIKSAGLEFYERLIRDYEEGELAGISAGVIQLFTDGLARLAPLLRKTTRFQGNICLVR